MAALVVPFVESLNQAPVALARMLALFPKALKALPVSDHRAAFDSYAHGYGFTPVAEGNTLKVMAGKSELIATFDERGKLKKLAGVNMAAPKKPAPKVKPVAKARPKPVAKLKPKAKTTASRKRK